MKRRVLDRPGRVEEDLDAVGVAQLADRAHVLERAGLTAGHVHVRLEREIRDLVGADLVDQPLYLGQVDVAFEREQALRVVRLVDDHVHELPARELLVKLRGGEVHVAGHVVSVGDAHLAQQVLGTPALMGGDDVLIAVVASHRLFEIVEVPRARVRFVAQHERRPLAVAHRARPRVGEKVDVDVFTLQ
jgi:hypothetical protein